MRPTACTICRARPRHGGRPWTRHGGLAQFARQAGGTQLSRLSYSRPPHGRRPPRRNRRRHRIPAELVTREAMNEPRIEHRSNTDKDRGPQAVFPGPVFNPWLIENEFTWENHYETHVIRRSGSQWHGVVDRAVIGGSRRAGERRTKYRIRPHSRKSSPSRFTARRSMATSRKRPAMRLSRESRSM